MVPVGAVKEKTSTSFSRSYNKKKIATLYSSLEIVARKWFLHFGVTLSYLTIRSMIVKMTPKRNDQLKFLDSWRNLTMLTTTYKIISKTMAERFKPIFPKIVN